jgi:hypothetical protein
MRKGLLVPVIVVGAMIGACAPAFSQTNLTKKELEVDFTAKWVPSCMKKSRTQGFRGYRESPRLQQLYCVCEAKVMYDQIWYYSQYHEEKYGGKERNDDTKYSMATLICEVNTPQDDD